MSVASTKSNLIDPVFQIRILSCKGLEDGLASYFQLK
jgi:hypothetical protein